MLSEANYGQREGSKTTHCEILYDLAIPRLGAKAPVVNKFLDQQFGSNQWLYCWLQGQREAAYGLDGVGEEYEHSYELFLQANPDLLDQLCNYGEVYDLDVTDIDSAYDYHNQTGTVHLQDIAVRHVMRRLNRQFSPSGLLLQIRSTSKDALGRVLSPFRVPFYRPDIILPYNTDHVSWDAGSLEAFYQSNRRLALATPPSSAELTSLQEFIESLPRAT